jgi:hypothetical protein
MRPDKSLAVKLRREGKSYNEISKELGIPKSTLSGWFHKHPTSERIRKMLTSPRNKAVAERIKRFAANNKLRWQRWREEARIEAERDFTALSRSRLFVTGIMLYWAEGDSNPKNPLRFTNTDPRMISLYVRFLTDTLSIPPYKLRVALVVYPDLSKTKCTAFWSKVTALPHAQFYKPQVIKGRSTKKRLPNGICSIVLGSRQMKEKVIKWIDLLSKNL